VHNVWSLPKFREPYFVVRIVTCGASLSLSHYISRMELSFSHDANGVATQSFSTIIKWGRTSHATLFCGGVFYQSSCEQKLQQTRAFIHLRFGNRYRFSYNLTFFTRLSWSGKCTVEIMYRFSITSVLTYGSLLVLKENIYVWNNPLFLCRTVSLLVRRWIKIVFHRGR
jgi:hypothetical protein